MFWESKKYLAAAQDSEDHDKSIFLTIKTQVVLSRRTVDSIVANSLIPCMFKIGYCVPH